MNRHQRQGSTIIKFLVLVAIIAILIGLLLPNTRRVREAAAMTVCSNKLKQIGLALHSYEGNVGLFPKGCTGKEESLSPEKRLSWYVALLPYLEEDKLAKKFDANETYTDQNNHMQEELRILKCALYRTEQKYFTSYVSVAGVGDDAAKRPIGSQKNGFMGYDRVTKISDIKDGLSNTICVVEATNAGPWAQAGESTLRGFDENVSIDFANGSPFGGMHYDLRWFLGKGYLGTNILMCDGSVRNVSAKQIDNKLLVKLITIADSDNPKENFEW